MHPLPLSPARASALALRLACLSRRERALLRDYDARATALALDGLSSHEADILSAILHLPRDVARDVRMAADPLAAVERLRPAIGDGHLALAVSRVLRATNADA